jgi:riboflavin kinase/FMN adenylyltransferase
MEIIRNFNNINQAFTHSVLTLGNFDGIHLGHQNILKTLRQLSQGAKTALLTFEPHPIKIINSSQPIDIRIISLAQKLRFLKTNNLVDIVFLANFTRQLADLEAEIFVQELLVQRLKIKHLVIGYDFVFGKNRRGDADLLEKLAGFYGFGFTKIGASKNLQDIIYSSTAIRKALIAGNVKTANSMLGRPYAIQGIVISGQRLARNLGFPTANILPKFNLLKPRFGVYKAQVLLNQQRLPAIVNFGIKPTFLGQEPLFEAHIFNFSEQIYGQKITIELLDFIRPEQKFAGIEELRLQIKKDCAYEAL